MAASYHRVSASGIPASRVPAGGVPAHLVDIIVINSGVKHGVEVIQEVNNLHRRAHSRNGGEANDVAEVNGDFLERFRVNTMPHHQTLGNRPQVEKHTRD